LIGWIDDDDDDDDESIDGWIDGWIRVLLVDKARLTTTISSLVVVVGGVVFLSPNCRPSFLLY